MRGWLLLLLLGSALGEQCRLPDNSAGTCLHIKDCKYQLGRFRVGSTVARCPAPKGSVCCPNNESLSQKKCKEWIRLLHAPPSYTQAPLKDPQCANGYRQFVVGGRDAELHEYPHAVSLGYGTDQKNLKYLCGATLISEKFLLTAAHCITHQRTGKPTYAMIGDLVLDPAVDPSKSSTYRNVVKIVKHIVHPEYKPPLIYNDIALLELATPLDLSRFVMPACLGSPLTTPKKYNKVEACGWGITDAASTVSSNVLQSINITTVDPETCNSIYGLEPDKAFRYPNGILKSQLCATGEDKDTCKGDSGGGMYTRESQCVFHVVGVTSIGSKVCGLGTPAVYTTVASYQDWIESTVWG